MEVVPLSVAYLLGFLYLWISIKKLDLIRTRWGLAFSAVCSFFLSFNMACGICAYFDMLPKTANVIEIFPYVVLIIGLENFWIITKSVMQTRKILEVKDRVAEGLENEGWYITKNLLVEMCLLTAAYISGVKAIQEFAVLAFVGYWTSFFMNMTFFIPILAVDTRRANLSECVTIRQSLEYGFFNISPAGELHSGHAHISRQEAEPSPMTLSIKAVSIIARWRIVQRIMMALIMLYFYHLIYLKIRWSEMLLSRSSEPPPPPSVLDIQLADVHNSRRQQCYEDKEAYNMLSFSSCQFLCGKQWPELFNYYFIHLNGTSLVVLPQLTISLSVAAVELSSGSDVYRMQNIFNSAFLERWKVCMIFALHAILCMLKK
jgi:hypothetical protein